MQTLGTLRNRLSAFLFLFSVLLLALHFLQLNADPNWHISFLNGQDHSSDMFTDEGWELNAAISAVLTGQWYSPGDMNLAVQSPLWPAVLYVPFKLLGVHIGIARALTVGLFVASAGLIFLFTRRLAGMLDAAIVLSLLSVNVLAFTFSRTAMVEPVFIFFCVLALYVALRSAEKSSLFLAFLAGVILSSALVVKLTALAVVFPVVAVLYVISRRRALIPAAVLPVGLFPVVQFFLLVSRYPLDENAYIKANILERRVSSFYQFGSSIKHVVVGTREVGPFLLLAFCCSAVFILSQWKYALADKMVSISLVWLLSVVVLLSTVGYFPPRYFLSLLFPGVLLAVRGASLAYQSNPRLGKLLYSLLALAALVDTTQVIQVLFHPTYSMSSLAKSVGTSPQPILMAGQFANTLSLYNGQRSINLATGTTSQAARIQSNDPTIFISRGPASAEDVGAFTTAGRTLTFERRISVMDNYRERQPVYIYSVGLSLP